MGGHRAFWKGLNVKNDEKGWKQGESKLMYIKSYRNWNIDEEEKPTGGNWKGSLKVSSPKTNLLFSHCSWIFLALILKHESRLRVAFAMIKRKIHQSGYLLQSRQVFIWKVNIQFVQIATNRWCSFSFQRRLRGPDEEFSYNIEEL